jgi:hypothetical protein
VTELVGVVMRMTLKSPTRKGKGETGRDEKGEGRRTCPDDRLLRVERTNVDLEILRPVLPPVKTFELGSAVRDVGGKKKALFKLEGEGA